VSHNSKPKDFDPYREWLGIRSDRRPVSPDALLGLRPGEETDKDLIVAAGTRQKERLDKEMLGKHSELARELTKEVSAAVSLLLQRAEAVVGQPVSPSGTDAKVGTPTDPVAKAPPPASDTWITGPSTFADDVVRPSQSDEHRRSTRGAAPVQGVPLPQGAPPGPGPASSSANLERLAAALGDLAAPDRPVVVPPISRARDQHAIPTLEEDEENGVAGFVNSLRRTDAALKEMVGEEYDILYKFFRALAAVLVLGAVVFCVWCVVSLVVGEMAARSTAPPATAAKDAPPPPPPAPAPTPVVELVAPEPLRLAPIPTQTIEVGKTLVVAVVAEGATAPDPTLRVTGCTILGGPKPAVGAAVDPATNTFRWTPTEDQGPGTYEATLSVESPDGRKAGAPFTVAVTKPASSTQPVTPVDLGGGVAMELVLIPAGSFPMGSLESDTKAPSSEKPFHLVRITSPFYLGKYEVTQEQWQAVMGRNPSRYVGPKNPVENVSWNDCQAFLTRLNLRTGMTSGVFTFPTEAQWEYACRAGSTTRWCFGDAEPSLRDYAWYGGNFGLRTSPVGQKRPNAWGLYDMHGNVGEWCADWFDLRYYAASPLDDPKGPPLGLLRVVRGGWWGEAATRTGSACRTADSPKSASPIVGFRVARTTAPFAMPSPQQTEGRGPPAPGIAPFPGVPGSGAAPYPPGMFPPGMQPASAAPYPGMWTPPRSVPRASNSSVVNLERGRVYQFGDWRMCWPSGGTDVYFWYNRGDTAVEIVGASNGFWRWRDRGRERTVWSVGGSSDGSFTRRPWMQSTWGAATVIGGFREFEVRGVFGRTRFSCDGKELTIVLTDRGTLSLSPVSPVIQFRTFNGKIVQFPSR